MNFGGFAGGFSSGFNNGVAMAKTIRDVIKERKLEDLRQQGMDEAERQRASSVQNMIKEGGVQATDGPASGPVDTATPKVETPAVQPQTAQQVSEASPTASPDPASAKTAAGSMAPVDPAAVSAASPTANPDPAGAAAATAAMPSGQAPVSPVQATPDQAVQATPQQTVTATGLTGKNAPKFTVNGVGYATREEAQAAAEKAAPSKMDLFMKNAVPKMAEAYVVNGEPEKAKAWTDYADSVTGKRAIKDWAAAYTAPDLDTAVSKFGRYYTDHINDGVDYTGHKIVTKTDGTQVAVVTLKDKATGKSQEMELTREKMLALGAANNPQKLFEQEVAKQTAAEKMKFEAGLKAQERREKNEDAVKLEGVKFGNQVKLEGVKSANKAVETNITQDRMDQRERIKSSLTGDEAKAKAQVGIDTKIDALIGAGYGEDEIKKMMPAIVGAGEHKKTTDPAERRALIASDLLKNDPSFARLDKDKQAKKVDDVMGVIYSDDAKPPAAKPGQAISDKPMAYDPKLPVKYQKGTGKPYHLVNGQYVPIQGTVPPATGGMPQR